MRRGSPVRAIGRGRGFIPGGGTDKRTQEIGRALYKAGGMSLMRRVHANVSGQVSRLGASRELDVAWDGIGDWQG